MNTAESGDVMLLEEGAVNATGIEEQGLEVALRNNILAVALNLKNMGLSEEDIAKAIDLSVEEASNL